jgi:hypothetical protein
MKKLTLNMKNKNSADNKSNEFQTSDLSEEIVSSRKTGKKNPYKEFYKKGPHSGRLSSGLKNLIRSEVFRYEGLSGAKLLKNKKENSFFFEKEAFCEKNTWWGENTSPAPCRSLRSLRSLPLAKVFKVFGMEPAFLVSHTNDLEAKHPLFSFFSRSETINSRKIFRNIPLEGGEVSPLQQDSFLPTKALEKKRGKPSPGGKTPFETLEGAPPYKKLKPLLSSGPHSASGLNNLMEGQANSKDKKFYTSYSKLSEVKLITIGLASPERIKQWAEKTLPNGKILGEVINANTLHHKTFKPQKGGLFCERIFGPLKDFECACGKPLKFKKENKSDLLKRSNPTLETVEGKAFLLNDDWKVNLTGNNDTRDASPGLSNASELNFDPRALQDSEIYKNSLRKDPLNRQEITAPVGSLPSLPLRGESVAFSEQDPLKNVLNLNKSILGGIYKTKNFCNICEVEYTWSVMRRYQLGYINLISPVTHVWYLKGNPSYLSILLDMKKRHLEYIVYCSETLTLENGLKGGIILSKSSDIVSSWKKLKTKIMLERSSRNGYEELESSKTAYSGSLSSGFLNKSSPPGEGFSPHQDFPAPGKPSKPSKPSPACMVASDHAAGGQNNNKVNETFTKMTFKTKKKNISSDLNLKKINFKSNKMNILKKIICKKIEKREKLKLKKFKFWEQFLKKNKVSSWERQNSFLGDRESFFGLGFLKTCPSSEQPAHAISMEDFPKSEALETIEGKSFLPTKSFPAPCPPAGMEPVRERLPMSLRFAKTRGTGQLFFKTLFLKTFAEP